MGQQILDFVINHSVSEIISLGWLIVVCIIYRRPLVTQMNKLKSALKSGTVLWKKLRGVGK